MSCEEKIPLFTSSPAPFSLKRRGKNLLVRGLPPLLKERGWGEVKAEKILWQKLRKKKAD